MTTTDRQLIDLAAPRTLTLAGAAPGSGPDDGVVGMGPGATGLSVAAAHSVISDVLRDVDSADLFDVDLLEELARGVSRL